MFTKREWKDKQLKFLQQAGIKPIKGYIFTKLQSTKLNEKE